ncbi:hypothetical protein DFH09DRAFT_1325631 [Mycena vulgaris]|nr:hypothetical protein DFH09DRAFT_1325631 [Mycena vulgaris]
MHNRSDTFHLATVFFAFVRKTNDMVATFRALRCLADIYDESGDEGTALSLYNTALKGATEMDIHRLRAESMTGIGDIMIRRGDPIQAKEMWEAAHPLFVRSSQMKDAAAINARLAQLSENPNCLIENGGPMDASRASELDPDGTKTISKLDELTTLSAPESPPLIVAEESSTNTTENSLKRNQGDPTSFQIPEIVNQNPDNTPVLV